MVKEKCFANVNYDSWEVYITQCENWICVRPVKGFVGTRGYSKFVTPPNWLERKLGITFQIKINDAIKDTQKLCDKWNRGIDKAKVQKQIYDEMVEML